MSEPEAQGNQAEDRAPRTGAPAPRPDPYAQFGNPLHDTWGTAQAQPSASPHAGGAQTVRRKRPALKWAITAGIVTLLAVAGWFARDAIIDAWDRVYDKAADLSSDDGETDQVPGGGPDSTTIPQSTDERLTELEAANDAAFDDWMELNGEALSAAVDRIDAAEADMAVVHQAVGSDDVIDLSVHRGAMVESRDATLAAVQLLDPAPESAVRNDFVTVLLLGVDTTGRMIAATDAQDQAGVRAASLAFQRVGSETMRLCGQYGNRAAALCK